MKWKLIHFRQRWCVRRYRELMAPPSACYFNCQGKRPSVSQMDSGKKYFLYVLVHVGIHKWWNFITCINATF